MKLSELIQKKAFIFTLAFTLLTPMPSSCPYMLTADKILAAPGQSQTLAEAQALRTYPEQYFTLSSRKIRLQPGESRVLKAEELKNINLIKWTVSDKSIIKVKKSDTSIRITGLADGVSAITAKAGGITWVCKVKVGSGGFLSGKTRRALGLSAAGAAAASGPYTSSRNISGTITLNKNRMMLEQGATEQLSAQISPSPASISWESSNAAVASVRDGLVTAISPGSTLISAKAGALQAGCEVIVVEHPKQARITEQGFSCYQTSDSAHCAISYAAGIQNPNISYNLAMTGADLLVRDKKGNILKQDSCLFAELAPQDTAYAVGNLNLDCSRENVGEISLIIHSIPVSSFYTHDDSMYLRTGFFNVSNTARGTDLSGGRRLTGYVHRNCASAGQYLPYITILFRRNGVLAGGIRQILNHAGQGPFEINLSPAQTSAFAACSEEYCISF